MPDPLLSLDRDWRAFAASRSGRRTFARWQDAEPVLRSVADLVALTTTARGLEDSDLDARDDLHLALLRLAGTEEHARSAMLHLLYPALARTARLYSDTWDRDEATSLVIAAALTRIVRYPHGLPRPAATIVNYVRRAMWTAADQHKRHEARLGRAVPLDDDLALEPPPPGAVDRLLDLVGEAVRAGAIDEAKARLFVLNRLVGIPASELAAEEGCPPATIRQRRLRTEAALARLASRMAA